MSAEVAAVKDTLAQLRQLAEASRRRPDETHTLGVLVPDAGMFSDGLGPLRTRLRRGESFRAAVAVEIVAAERRLRCLPGPPCELCGNRVEPASAVCRRCSATLFRERVVDPMPPRPVTTGADLLPLLRPGDR